MPLYKKLKRIAGKYMGKQIPRVTKDQDKAVELSQPGMIDKTPIHLRLLSRQEGERVICFGTLVSEHPRILHNRGVADLYPPVMQPLMDLLRPQ